MRTTNPTSKKGERLLAVLRVGGTVMAACQAARIHRSTYYAWRAADPEFAAQADDAIESGTDELEDIARQRAITGSSRSRRKALSPWVSVPLKPRLTRKSPLCTRVATRRINGR